MNAKVTGIKRLLRQDILLAALALGCGIGGAWLAGRYLDARAAAAESQLAGRYVARAVVVAGSDIAAGETVQQAKLAVRRMPQEFLPSDAVPEERVSELLGGQAAIAIRRGTPIVPAAVRTGTLPRLSELLVPGERALTVPVDEINSHAGAIEVGDRIDVYYRPARSGDVLLMPLLQQVEVLAVGTTFLPAASTDESGSERHYGTVTLRVTEHDAGLLLLAQAAGELALLMRAPGDAAKQVAVLRSSRELLQSTPRRKVSGLEVLTGGSGGATPVRTWLSVGASIAVAAGDAS